MPGVKERWQTGLGNYLVEDVGFAIIGIEFLDGRVKFEATYPKVLDEATGLACAHLALGRVDAGEGDEHIRVLSRDLGHLLIGHPDLPGRGLHVDREDDTGHLALSIVGRDLGNSRARPLILKV